jgi:hypothetical protein
MSRVRLQGASQRPLRNAQTLNDKRFSPRRPAALFGYANRSEIPTKSRGAGNKLMHEVTFGQRNAQILQTGLRLSGSVA